MTVDDDRGLEAPEREPATGRAVLGILLVLTGLVWLGERLDLFDVSLRHGLPVALVVVGLAVMALSFRGRQSGLTGLGIVLTILSVLAALAPSGGIDASVGDRRHVVDTMAELESEYGLGVGNLVVDLSGLDVDGRVEIEIDLGMGDLEVVLPPDVAVSVSGEAGLGQVVLFGERSEGVSPRARHESDGFASAEDSIAIDASVFLGSVEVER